MGSSHEVQQRELLDNRHSAFPHIGLHEKQYELKNTVLAQRHDLLHWELDT